jgi:hypothetical protein
MGRETTFFMSGNSRNLVSYGSPSSSRIMTVFQGFGPPEWEYNVMGLRDNISGKKGCRDGNLTWEKRK